MGRAEWGRGTCQTTNPREVTPFGSAQREPETSKILENRKKNFTEDYDHMCRESFLGDLGHGHCSSPSQEQVSEDHDNICGKLFGRGSWSLSSSFFLQ